MGRGFGGRGGGFGGLGGFGDMGKLMKDMQKLQSDMLEKQEALKDDRIEATSGGGAVKAIVTGKGRLVGLEIKPEAVDPDDVEMLQDLLITAINEAEDKAEEHERQLMEKLTAGLPVPPGLF